MPLIQNLWVNAVKNHPFCNHMRIIQQESAKLIEHSYFNQYKTRSLKTEINTCKNKQCSSRQY